jgi:hypothetical protein
MRNRAIRNTHPTVVTVSNDEKAWDNDGNSVTLDESKISVELARLQAEYDTQEYARKRKAEYDALNQFEMQFDDKEDGTTTWEDAIVAIKTKYPKG